MAAEEKFGLLEALKERFTCKRYDGEAISEEELAYILEAARLSPTSFGFEPFKLLRVTQEEHRAAVLERAWGMKKRAAETFVILAKKNVTADSAWIDSIMSEVKGLDEEAKAQRAKVFADWQKSDFVLQDEQARSDWAAKQCYIVLANMLAAAAVLGVDATPIEGFNKEALTNYLVEEGLFDGDEFEIAVLVQFGHRSKDHMEVKKTRRPLEDILISD